MNVSISPSKQHSPTTTVVSIHIIQIKLPAIVIPTRHKALQVLCTQNNIQFKRFATENLGRQVHYAISDSEATGHFLVKGAPVVNKKKAINPVTITLPSGGTIQSTHTYNLNIPWLPHHVMEAHIVPGITHASLILTRKFCAAGCQVAFSKDECRVFYEGELVLVGGQRPTTDL